MGTARFTGSVKTLREMAKERNVKYLDNSMFQKLLNIQESMASKVESLETFNQTGKDSEETLRAGQKFKNELTKILNDFTRAGAEAELAMEAGLYEHSKLSPSGFDSEIRSVVRSMSGSDRISFINTALQNKDTKILSAILPENVPPSLSGIDIGTQTMYRETFFGIVLPEFMETREAYRELYSNVSTTYDVAKQTADTYSDDRKLSELDRREGLHKEAKTKLGVV